MANNYIDPAFQIGMMLGDAYGNMWAANAKKRQGAKADDIIEQMRNQREIQRIADLRTPPANENAGQAVANQMAQQQAAQAAGQITSLGNLNTGMQNLGVNKGIDYLGMGDQLAEQQDPYKLSVPSPLDQLKSQVGKEYAINQANKASVDAIKANQAYESTLSPYESKVANWNPDYTEDNVRKALEKAGLADDVIDKKVGEAKKDIAERAEAVLMPSIRKNMFYGYDTLEKDNDGNVYTVHHDPDAQSFMQAAADLELLKKYSPDTYKSYMGQMVGPQALYQERVYDKRYDKQVKTQRENMKQQHDWKVQDSNTNWARRVYLAGQKTANGNGKYSISTADYKEAQKSAGEIEAYYQEQRESNPNFKLPPSMQEEWEESRSLVKQYRRERMSRAGNGQTSNNSSSSSDGDKQGVDWNDWDSINAGINQVLKDGYTAKDVLELAAEHLGTDHPWYKMIASSFDHETAKRKKEEEEAEAKRQLQETLYPQQYGTNTTDQTIAKIVGFGSDVANGRPVWNIAHR